MRYRFSPFLLDTTSRELRCDERAVAIAPKAFAVLVHLIDHRDRIVTKAELLDAFWPHDVSDNLLQSAIRHVRRALGDDGRRQAFVKTAHGRGFRFVCPVVEDRALEAEGDAPLDDATLLDLRERRPAAAFCCRFERPSTAPRDEAADALQGFFRAAKAIVERHGGAVLHVAIDGFTALFGLARDGDDPLRTCLACAAELFCGAEADGARSAGLRASIGVDVGGVVLRSDAIGEAPPPWAFADDVVERAMALQARAEPWRIVMSAAAHRPIATEVTAQAIDDERVVFSGFSAQRAGVPRRSGAVGAAFVGRSRELAALRDRFAKAAASNGELVMVTGGAGIGKSRLVEEFRAALGRAGVDVVIAECLPRLADTPLAPFASLFRRIARRERRASDEALASVLRRTIGAEPSEAQLLARLIGEGEATAPETSPQEALRRSFVLMRRLLAQCARDRPTAYVIEDAHWMDASSRAFLDELTLAPSRPGLFFLVTSRAPIERLTDDERPATHIVLAPLDRADAVAFLRSLPGMAEPLAEDVDQLARRAGGNPFFLEELALAWRAGARGVEDGLPHSVQAVLANRLGQLASAPRQLLEVMAVVGPVADARLARWLTGWSEAAFERQVRSLVDGGLIVAETRAETRSFRFRHILIHEAAYGALAPRDRARLHGEIARHLEAERVDLRATAPESLAWHLQQSGEAARAIASWRAASRLARMRSTGEEAVAFAKKGLRLLARIDDDRERARLELDLQLALAPALVAARGYGADDAGEAYDRARALSIGAGAPLTRFRIGVGLWNYHWVRGELATAENDASDLLAIANARDDAALFLRAHACMGEVSFHRGDVARAARHLDEAVALFEAAPEADAKTLVPVVACYCYAAWVSFLLDRAAEARRCVGAAETIAKTLASPFSEALCAAFRAELHWWEGDVEACLEAGRRGAWIAEENGFPFWRGSAGVSAGWAMCHSGDHARGLEQLRDSIAVFRSTSARVQLAKYEGLHADALLACGEIANAQERVAAALQWAERMDDRYFAPELRLIEARILRARGREDEADAATLRARRIAAEQGRRKALGEWPISRRS